MAAREVHVKPEHGQTPGHARIFRDEGLPEGAQPLSTGSTSEPIPEVPPVAPPASPQEASLHGVRSVPAAPSSEQGAPPSGQGVTSSDQAEGIRRDIEHTRARLDMTIGSIQERLSPRYIAQQAKDAMKTRSKQTGNRIVGTIKQHPLPAALAGAGLAWLIGAAMRDRSSAQACVISEDELGYEYEYTGEYPVMYRSGEGELEPGETGSRAEQIKQAGRSAAQTAQQKAHEASEQARAKAAQMKEQARVKASQMKEQARAKASQMGEQARHMGEQARAKASHMGEQARAKASHMSEQARHMSEQALDKASQIGEQARVKASQAGESARDIYQEYPLAVGLGALAAGLLAGLVAPSTRKEDEWMGETRDDLLRGAKEYGSEMLEKGQAVAGRAMEAATEEAQHQKVMPGQVRSEASERMGKVASAAKEAAKDEAGKQGMTSESSQRKDQPQKKKNDETAQPGGDKI